MSKEKQSALIALTADIVAAHVANNYVATNDMPLLIKSVHDALVFASSPAPKNPEKPTPAVPARKSVYSDYLVCLEDGKKLKMLKRHLMTHYQMTPDEYRAKWQLPSDYPMVAPNYAKHRKALAIKIGLGQSRRKKL